MPLCLLTPDMQNRRIIEQLLRQAGSEVAPTLESNSNRGTWLSFGNKRAFKILVEGDPKLINQYGVILVNPEKHPGVKVKEGQAFIDWLIGPDGQAAIASYKVNGEQLFFPDARTPKDQITPKDQTMKPAVRPHTSP